MQHWLNANADGVTIAWHIALVVVLAIIAHIAVRRGIRHLVLLSQERAQERAAAAEEAAARGVEAEPQDDSAGGVTGLPVVGAVVGAVSAVSDVIAAPKPRRRGRRKPAPGSLAAGRGLQRAATLCQGIGVLVDIVLVIIVALTILGEFNVKLAPLLTTAGIGGVALAFGAQSLVKDILSGIFIVMEDQYGVGDTITVGSLSGTVQTIGLRVTRLQDMTGQIWYVRNGEIATLGNRTQGWSLGKIELPLPLHADPSAILELLQRVSTELDKDPQWRGQLMEPPLVLGITSFDAVAATYTVQLKCPATKQVEVERELRARALHALQDAGIPVGVHPEALAVGHPSTGVAAPTVR